jgi:hypothetical protein
MRCPKCHRELADDEPVYHLRFREGMWGIRYRVRAYYTAVLYVCGACGHCPSNNYREYRCTVCQRPVCYRISPRLKPPCYVIACSPECREKAHNRRAYARRRNIEVQLPPRPCPVCGIPFASRRSDAKVCSTRCRMRQYRARQASA